MKQTEEQSPSRQARIAGLFYLLTIVAGMAGLFFHGRLALATNLLAGFAYMAVTILFYFIFSAVSRSISLISGAFSILGFIATTLDWNPLGINGLVFFGVYCLLIAYLIFRSSFLPSVLGVLMGLAGLNWLTYLSPYLAKHMHPYNLIPGLVGEGALTLWLLAVGLNSTRWHEQAQTRTRALEWNKERA